MVFEFVVSDELKETIAKLNKKDKITSKMLQRKMNQIIDFDEITINHFKNLRHDLSEYKRVHISKSFILLFRVDKAHNQIRFESLKHHDEAYK